MFLINVFSGQTQQMCGNTWKLEERTSIASRTGYTEYPMWVFTAPLAEATLDFIPPPYPAEGPFVDLPGIDHTHPLAAMRPLSRAVTWEEAEEIGIAYLHGRVPWDKGASVGHRTKPLTLAIDREYTVSEDGKERTEHCQTYRCDIDGVSYAFFIRQPAGAYDLAMGTVLGGVLGWLERAGVINLSPKEGKFCLQLVGHYTLADLQGFVGRQVFPRLDRSGGAHFTGSPVLWRIYPHQTTSKGKVISLTIRDTMAFTPDDDRSLDALGEFIGRPKVVLPVGAIERMDGYMHEDPERFVHYAIADADIALLAGALIWGHNSVWPATIASQSTKIARESLIRQGGHQNKEEMLLAYRGTVLQEEEENVDIDGNLEVSKRKGKKRKVHKPSTEMAKEIAVYAKDAYAGGLNIALVIGYIALAAGLISDIDARSFYPVIMSLLYELDMTSDPIYLSSGPTKLADYPDGIHTYGFARAEIEVPEGVIIPIPWENINGGPVFVNKVTGSFTLATIWYALRQGAKVKILKGFKIPANPNNKPYREYVGHCLRSREVSDNKWGKKSIQSRINKLTINATYGQIARGVRKKKIYDARTKGFKDMPMSDITHPVYAAYITAIGHIIIAAVVEELKALGYKVYTAITDGLTTDAPLEVVEALILEGINKQMMEARQDMGVDPQVWEVKGQAKEMVVVDAKIEAFVGKAPDNNHAMMQGLKPPPGLGKKSYLGREWLLKMWANRIGTEKQTRIRLANIKDIQRGGHDYRYQWQEEVAVRLDYGSRRIPTEVEPVIFRGQEVARVETRAPRDKQEALDMLEARAHARKRKEIIKTKEDYDLMMLRKKEKQHQRQQCKKAGKTEAARAPRSKNKGNHAFWLLTQYRAGRYKVPQFEGLSGAKIQTMVALAYPQLSKYAWKDSGRKSIQDGVGYSKEHIDTVYSHCLAIWRDAGMLNEDGTLKEETQEREEER